MEVKLKSLNDTLTVRENVNLIEITIRNEKDFAVFYFGKTEAKKIVDKLTKYINKK